MNPGLYGLPKRTGTVQLWDPHYDGNPFNSHGDEFDTGPSLGGAYTAVSLGTSTHDVNKSMPGALVIQPQSSAAGWRGWARVLPPGDFTVTACITIMTTASNYTLGGIMLSNGAGTGANYLIYVGWNGRPNVISESGSNWDSSGVSAFANWTDIGGHQRIILRLRRIGTTVWTGWSTDGRNFSEASRTDSTTYGYFGPAFYNSNAGGVGGGANAGLSVIVFDYLRYQPNGSAVYGKMHTLATA